MSLIENCSINYRTIWKLIFFICLLDRCKCLEIIVIYEKSNIDWNSQLLMSSLPEPNSVVELHNCEFSNISACFNYYENSILAVDLTESSKSQFIISQICTVREIPHLVFENKLSYFDEWTFSAKPSSLSQINAFIDVLIYFGWTQGLVIYDGFKNTLRENLEKYSVNLNYLNIEPKANIEEIVNRIITPLGETLYYIFMNPTESLKLQNLLMSTKLLTSGNGILLDQKSGYQCIVEGALIITEKPQELISSEENYRISAIGSVISSLLKSIKSENAYEMLYHLNLLSKNHYIFRNFSLINIQNGERVIVGEIIDGNLSLFSDINFSGNSTDIPNSAQKILHLSIEAGSTNPTGPPITVGLVGGYGSYAAIDVINEGNIDLLNNFQVEMFNFDCGTSIYNSAFANSCYLKDKDKFGLGHVSAWSSVMAIGSMKSFKELNLTFPIVSATNGDITLNSTADYPMYMRVQPSFSFEYSLISIFIRALGWKQIAVLYQNDSWGLSGYLYFLEGIKNHDISIINPENKRVIAPDLDRDEVKEYSGVLQQLIDCQARFLVSILHFPTAYYIFEELYDLGLRKGDLVIFTTVTDLATFEAYDDKYLYKLNEIAVPMISIYGQSWVGSLGKKALDRISEAYGGSINSYSCFYFDSVFLIAYALDFMINRGLDYTDPNKLQKIMRNIQFYGCTGKVNIEKGSNDRILQIFEIIVNKLDASDNITTYIMGQFKPQSTQLINIQEPLEYSNGSTTKPSDLRTSSSQCPFPDKLIKTFAKGRILVFGICFAVALISFAITFYIWKKWWKFSIEPLTVREEICLQDIIVAVTIIIEFFQLSSMGPDFSPINSTLAGISNFFSLSLDNILKLRNGVFWIIVNAVFGSIGLWVFLCSVVLLRLDEKFPMSFIFRNLGTLAEYLMPVLGDLCFIPFISICLDIFLCDQSIGDNFTDSFLAADCYYFCWKDEHLFYAIFSVIALIAYEPLAVFGRPLWQELQPILHVKAVPLFLMVKTMIQIILIVMNKTVKRAQNLLHGALFIFVMIIYIAFLYKFKPFNYQRYSWWQTLVSVGVVWLALISVIEQSSGVNPIFLLSVLCFGFLIIGLLGVYVQRKKYPSLLFRKKGQDTSNLFKFAFTFGRHSKAALSKIVPSSLPTSARKSLSARKIENPSP
ncbi:unnamed protein product [Blepharisma stoltei]|uniref:Receptor ligand binding region domain-containing protein n=1 Tax=Blepharisma stoltei TaxID=1481888 RepID=A0AAU9K664_9CILI|nr:unnamed protein product [Blepharisma stoltei]